MRNAAVTFVLLLLTLTVPPVCAQADQQDAGSEAAEDTSPAVTPGRSDEPNLRQIVEQEERAETITRQASEEPNYDTPRSALITISLALDRGDFEAAAEALDMRYLPPGIKVEDGPKLIQGLRHIFVRHIWIDIASLSNEPEGWLDDGLPPYRDSIGIIETAGGPVELYVQRIPDGKGGQQWKISNATVAQIPALWEEFGFSEFAGKVSHWLPQWHALGIDNWQWAYLAVFLICLAGGVSLLYWFLSRLALRSDAQIIVILKNFLRGPLGFFVYIMAVRAFMLSLGLSVVARALFNSVFVVYLAYVFLVLGVVQFFANRVRHRMHKSGRHEAVAIVRPIAAVIKIVLVAIVIILGFDNAGYDVTTIIAGLGVGSVAVALAAQRTLENLIGAITIYIARPVQPGDFCRFGEKVGTVEEIGLRATLLRTLDRTLVSIPNAIFAAGEVENYSARDNIRYYRMLALRLSTTPDQLRYVLARLRELLYAHPEIQSESISVRLFSINDYAHMVRLDSRVMSNDFQQYLAIAEDINLRIIDLVQEAGTNFAYPSQTVMVEDAAQLDRERQGDVEALVEQWREQDKLPFPQWPDEYVAKVENTLEYPSHGASAKLRNTEFSDERG